MFWLATARMLLRPMPPMPTQAMLSRSLGGVKPCPSTCLGTIVRAAPVAAAVSMKCLRVTPGFFSSIPPPFRGGHDIPSVHEIDDPAPGARGPRVGAYLCCPSRARAVAFAVRREIARWLGHLQVRRAAEEVGNQGRHADQGRQCQRSRFEGSVRRFRAGARVEYRGGGEQWHLLPRYRRVRRHLLERRRVSAARQREGG